MLERKAPFFRHIIELVPCWLAACVLSGCDPTETEPSPAPVYAADWATSYTEVRDCRRSGDHDLNYVRILAAPDALGPYQTRDAAFPDGAVVLKLEFADPACTDRSGLTAMRREAGFDATHGDWHWQRLDQDEKVFEDGKLERCVGCHASCGVAPDGHDWTCAVP
ncbi:MAG: hypothetical protein EXR75_02380 [Myxococcales bacterium]|nr:hypothetical protein [Myxococcales bacterium]